MKNKCDITVVLDKSGSMWSIKGDTEGGFKRFVEEQKALPGEVVLSLIQFDTSYEVIYSAKPLRDVPALFLLPGGCTALLDALGRAIDEAGQRFSALPEAERPNKVVFVIITDGLENSSIKFTKAQINDKIKTQREKYSWEFVFLGANQDAIQEGKAMGIDVNSSLTYGFNAKGVAASFTSMSSSLGEYRSGNARNIVFSNQQRKEAE